MATTQNTKKVRNCTRTYGTPTGAGGARLRSGRKGDKNAATTFPALYMTARNEHKAAGC